MTTETKLSTRQERWRWNINVIATGVTVGCSLAFPVTTAIVGVTLALLDLGPAADEKSKPTDTSR